MDPTHEELATATDADVIYPIHEEFATATDAELEAIGNDPNNPIEVRSEAWHILARREAVLFNTLVTPEEYNRQLREDSKHLKIDPSELLRSAMAL